MILGIFIGLIIGIGLGGLVVTWLMANDLKRRQENLEEIGIDRWPYMAEKADGDWQWPRRPLESPHGESGKAERTP